jgi:hypothetical protein
MAMDLRIFGFIKGKKEMVFHSKEKNLKAFSPSKKFSGLLLE